MRKMIIIIAISQLFSSTIFAQHPDRKKIDSLKQVLPSTHDIGRIDCLNELSVEYWWTSPIYPDSVSMWADPAFNEASKINYQLGIANSLMHLGVADIYRKNFLSSEKYLRQSLALFKVLGNDKGLGWCNDWLGQNLYFQNHFINAISCFDTSLSYLQKLNDWEGEGKAWAWKGFLSGAMGDFDNSVNYFSKSLLIREQMRDHVCVAGALNNMGYLYRVAGAFDDALDYYNQAKQYANDHTLNYHTDFWNYNYESLGSIYRILDMPDSSLRYLEEAVKIDPGNQMAVISLAETLLLKGEYDSALTIFLKPIGHFRKENDRWDLMRVLLDAAKAYAGKGNNAAALRYGWESLSISEEARIKPFMIESYSLLSTLYERLSKSDSAYFYLKQYASLKNSLTTEQFRFSLSNYKKQSEFKKQQDEVLALNKDNQIKEEKLEHASELTWILIACLLVVGLSGFIIYRNLSLKRKNEKLENLKKQSELQLKASELEMQALRAQMSPHFIFNCLSSINRFILKNETEAASDYLTKFSRLIRMVLTNSNKTFISLEDELDMLRLYMDMERLRFKNSFDYSIRFTNSIEESNVFVPPLLLQPFAENAIWHGLMHKEGQGRIEIELSTDKKVLTCIISDNGIGRSKAAMLRSKSAERQKSMGLKITTERLSLLNQHADEKTFFNIEDNLDDEGNEVGTRVILKMNYRGLMEVPSDDLITKMS